MDETELNRRLTVLEDIEAIKQLKAEYCAISDTDHDPDRMAAIFAEDGIWDGPNIGYAVGRAEVRKLFAKFAELISFSQHNVFNPRIELKGPEAHAFWYFIGIYTFRKGNRQVWAFAQYDDDYVKLDGVWKIKHLRARPRALAPYETGWANPPKLDLF